jgi:undecaprenyl-diphosphatase|tara:strand:- start:844 stop:1446 length:603 start_codon:yes stop_codon:yes gene_type:complete
MLSKFIELDYGVTLFINGLSGNFPILDLLVQIIASDYLMPVSFCLFLFFLWFSGNAISQRNNNQKVVLTGILSVGLGNLLVLCANLIWNRPRPFLVLENSLNLVFYRPTDPSFPINPVVIGISLSYIIYMQDKSLGTIVFLLSLSMGFARVFVGVSFFSDLLGALLFGIISGLISIWIRKNCENVFSFLIKIAKGFGLAG